MTQFPPRSYLLLGRDAYGEIPPTSVSSLIVDETPAHTDSGVPEPAETPRRSGRRRLVLGIAPAVVIVLIAIPAWSLGRVMLANNTDPLSIRFVEWARDHHLGGLVNRVENYWYTTHPPPKGGSPKGGIPTLPASAAPASTPARSVASVRNARGVQRTLPLVHPPAPVVPFVATPLPGEGAWRPIGREIGGIPVAWVTYLRPDTVHTSELIGMVHFDMHSLTATLHAGTSLPGGGPWQNGPKVDPSNYGRVVAAFNSAFKLNGSHGGYYSEGRMVQPLVAGRASFVTYRDGHADVALWGRDATMTPDVTSVRQNLVLLVDQGRLAPDLSSSGSWDGTVGAAVYVWRSAVCVDAHHDLVYAAGPGLDVMTLAQAMQRAGCVRAMELDINSWWVTLTTFTPDGHGGVVPWKLLPSMVRNADRYLVTGTRDFIEIDAR